MRSRQLRFVLSTVGGWVMVRAGLIWLVGEGIPEIGATIAGGKAVTVGALPPSISPHRADIAVTANEASGPSRSGWSVAGRRDVMPATAAAAEPAALEQEAVVVLAQGDRASAKPRVDAAPFLPSIDPSVRPDRPASAARWSGSVFTYLRGGGGGAAAPGGQLGGSQAGARIALRLDSEGRFTAAGRLYAPLRSKGAEAAFGLDWHPLPGIPLRISAERRIGLDRAGRDAWSLYTAGGFYAGRLPLGLEADGYGQAGVVGLHARERFVDGALRIGRRVAAGRGAIVIGAGAWGAAQRGAARFDVGPHVAGTWQVAGRSITLALDGRVRVAGQAAPGSGVTATLAHDF